MTYLLYFLIALGATTVGSLMGMGGGVIIKPLLDVLGGIALTTGFSPFDLSMLPVIVVGAVAGGFIGATLNKKLPEDAVDRAFNAVQLLVLAPALFNIARILL